jgi:hypothetical protein
VEDTCQLGLGLAELAISQTQALKEIGRVHDAETEESSSPRSQGFTEPVICNCQAGRGQEGLALRG